LFSLALAAKSFISNEISYSPFKFEFLIIGVSNPESVCTATLISTFLYYLMKSPCQEELHSGTLIQAKEAALINISFTDILLAATELS
jgi:hypothetical protein